MVGRIPTEQCVNAREGGGDGSHPDIDLTRHAVAIVAHLGHAIDVAAGQLVVA